MGEGGGGRKKIVTWQDYFQSLATDFTTGGVAASIAKTINAPIERIKIVLQVQHLKPIEQRYNGLIDCAIRMPQREGFWAFWRGNLANVIRYFPTQALNFAFNDKFKQIFTPLPASSYPAWELAVRNMISGGLAGGLCLFFVYPMDFARTRLSADIGKAGEKKYTGFMDVIKKTMVSEGGFFSLYRGFGISVAGIIPYRAVYFGGYDTLKYLFLANDPKPSFWKKWLIAQVNTTAAQFLTYPIDTIRRRLMMKGEKEGKKKVVATATPVEGAPATETVVVKPAEPVKPKTVYRNSWHCFVVILKEEGPKGLFKGAWANTIRATGGALCMLFYDELNTYLKKHGYRQ